MRRGLLCTISVVLALTGLTTLVSATTYGPINAGAIDVVASGNRLCYAFVTARSVPEATNGDVVIMYVDYQLNAPGVFDRARGDFWFTGQVGQGAETDGSASGKLSDQKSVLDGQTYQYNARAQAWDFGNRWCDHTSSDSLFT